MSAARGSALPHATYGGLVDPANVPGQPRGALLGDQLRRRPDRPSAAQLTKEIDELKAAYQEASPIFGSLRLNELLMCYGRPKGSDYMREKVRDVHTPKMLLVGTRGDPATPYRWTEETAERLGSAAVVLDNKGEGHAGYASSKCVQGHRLPAVRLTAGQRQFLRPGGRDGPLRGRTP